jgi:phage portal protein BeeE
MSSVLTKAIDQGNACIAQTMIHAQQMKDAGTLISSLSPGIAGESMFGGYKSQQRNKENYGAFHGWLYSAINALASESAGQPATLARIESSKTTQKKRGPSGKKSIALLPKHVRAKAAQQELDVLIDHPLIKSLEQPNPIQARWQFVYSFVASLNLTGWAYVVFDVDKDGNLEMYSLPSTWVRPDHKNGPFSRFYVSDPKDSSASVKEPLTRDNVAFAYLPDPGNPLSAIAPVTSQMPAVRIDRFIQSSQEQHFRRGIFPSVVVTIGKDPHPDVPGGIRPRLSGAQRRQVHAAINKAMGGIANYGSPAIVDGLIENIARFSNTENEMGWSRSEDKIRTRILSAFGVHPYILGEPVSVGGYAQAAKIEERFCKRVNTFLEMLSLLVTKVVQSTEGQEDLQVWWEEAKPHDPSLRWQGVQFARTNGDISQNELRAELGYPPDEDSNQANLSGSGAAQVVQLLAQVGAGAITNDQAKATMVAMGLSDDQATAIAGQPSKEATVQQATEAVNKAIAELKRPISFDVGSVADALVTKFNPSQPRDRDGQFASGGGSSSPSSSGSSGPSGPSGPSNAASTAQWERRRDREEGTQKEADREVVKADKAVAKAKSALESARQKLEVFNEVRDEVRQRMAANVEKLLAPVQSKISSLSQELSASQKRMADLKAQLKEIKERQAARRKKSADDLGEQFDAALDQLRSSIAILTSIADRAEDITTEIQSIISTID